MLSSRSRSARPAALPPDPRAAPRVAGRLAAQRPGSWQHTRAAPLTAEECFARLHAAGWSVGEAAFTGASGLGWVVLGYNGENLIRATGSTSGQAWRAACAQARALGMLGRAGRSPGPFKGEHRLEPKK
jgi:hypothetical protein